MKQELELILTTYRSFDNNPTEYLVQLIRVQNRFQEVRRKKFDEFLLLQLDQAFLPEFEFSDQEQLELLYALAFFSGYQFSYLLIPEFLVRSYFKLKSPVVFQLAHGISAPIRDGAHDIVSLQEKTGESHTFDFLRPIELNPVIDHSDRYEISHHMEVVVLSKLLLAIEALGATRKAIDLSVQYSKDRKQFEVPIGSFQAISQMLAQAEADWSSVEAILKQATILKQSYAQNNLLPDDIIRITAALQLASDTLPTIVERMIQAHGGIGFTFEYPLHLILRKVVTYANLVSNSEREAFGELLVGKLSQGQI